VHLFKQFAFGDYNAAARMNPIIDYGESHRIICRFLIIFSP